MHAATQRECPECGSCDICWTTECCAVCRNCGLEIAQRNDHTPDVGDGTRTMVLSHNRCFDDSMLLCMAPDSTFFTVIRFRGFFHGCPFRAAYIRMRKQSYDPKYYKNERLKQLTAMDMPILESDFACIAIAFDDLRQSKKLSTRTSKLQRSDVKKIVLHIGEMQRADTDDPNLCEGPDLGRDI